MSHLLRAATALAITIIVGGCSLNITAGSRASGPVVTEPREATAFHAVKLALAANATIEVGKTTSVAISAQKSLLPIIKTTVTDGTLVISADQLYASTSGVNIRIQTPDLDSV